MNSSYVRAVTVLAAVLSLAGLVMLLANDAMQRGSPAAAEFRCGYEAQRAGIEDPLCEEATRPAPPSQLRAESPEAPLSAEISHDVR